jgi:hypothetical protein
MDLHRLRVTALALLCVILGVVLFGAPASRARAPLPSELSDAEFWRIASTFSEEGGGFLSENFVSNELGYPYIMPSVIERVRPGGAYIGVGPEQNFTYIAAIRPGLAFVVDIRRQNMIEHLLYKAIFELSENRAEFLSRLFARRPAAVKPDAATDALFAAFEQSPRDEAFYRATLDAVKDRLVRQHKFELGKDDIETLEHVYEEFAKQGPNVSYSVLPGRMRTGILLSAGAPVVGTDAPAAGTPPPSDFAGVILDFPSYAEVMKASDPKGKQWSYLAAEDSYRAVREMQRRNLIVPLVGDFAGSKALLLVGKYLKERDAKVAAFYVSNVEQYLTPLPKLISFYFNVHELPLDASSTFIRSAQLKGVQPGHAQSSVNAMQPVVEAVLQGRAQNWADIFMLASP